jgi:hypothetical protein
MKRLKQRDAAVAELMLEKQALKDIAKAEATDL